MAFVALLIPYTVWFFDLDWSVRIGAAFLLAFYAALALGETVASVFLALRSRLKREAMAMRRHLFSVIVRSFCGVLPLLMVRASVQLRFSDRCYLDRHRQDLEAVVNGADPEHFGFMDVYREQRWTVIQAVNFSIGDCYWIIYSPDVFPSEEAATGGSVLHQRLWKVKHIWGPWYSLLS